MRRARGRAVGGGGTLFGFLILRLVAAWSDAAERELHGGGAQPRNIDAALRKSSMSTVLAIVDQRQEQVDGARASGPHPRRELPRALHRARKRIGLFVGGGSSCLEQNLGTELALEKKLGRLARMRDDGGQKVAARRSLFAAVRKLLCQPSEDQQIGLGMGGSHSGAGQTVLTRKALGPSFVAPAGGPTLDRPVHDLNKGRRKGEKQ